LKSQQLAETRFASALDQGFQRREIDGTAHEFGTICGFGHGAKLHSSVSRYTSDPPSHGFLIAQILLTKFLLKVRLLSHDHTTIQGRCHYGANLDTVHQFALDAALGDDIGHGLSDANLPF